MRNFHLPVWLVTPGLPRPRIFVALFSLAVVPRTVLITVLPLQALAHFGDAQKVSVLYLVISLMGLSGSLTIPWLVHHLRRRWVFSLGALCGLAAALLFSLGGLPGFVIAMVLQIISVAAVEITLNLYVMDHVPRHELSRFEPTRVFFAGGAFVIGPLLGVTLQNRWAEWAPFAFSASALLLLLGFFWFLRLTENPVVSPMRKSPPRPLAYVRRFFGQPRLRLAYFLAVGRSGWWSMFFIYGPIYAVTSGLSEEQSGGMVSLGLMATFLVPVWGWVGRRYGLRRLLVCGYAAAGLVTVAVALTAGLPLVGAGVLLFAALMTSSIDGAGNLPFLRAVHPLERPEMTTVFATYRDSAQFLPPGFFALLLRGFDLPVVFIAGGVGMMVLAGYARFVPRRL